MTMVTWPWKAKQLLSWRCLSKYQQDVDAMDALTYVMEKEGITLFDTCIYIFNVGVVFTLLDGYVMMWLAHQEKYLETIAGKFYDCIFFSPFPFPFFALFYTSYWWQKQCEYGIDIDPARRMSWNRHDRSHIVVFCITNMIGPRRGFGDEREHKYV